jgi:hypothetical protein
LCGRNIVRWKCDLAERDKFTFSLPASSKWHAVVGVPWPAWNMPEKWRIIVLPDTAKSIKKRRLSYVAKLFTNKTAAPSI